MPPPLAVHAAELLGHCDELRFAGEAVDLAGFVASVNEACRDLAQLKPSRTAGASR